MTRNNKKCTKIDVEAYSGYKANERPVSFVQDDRRIAIREVMDRWYGQDHDYFKVIAEDGCTYLLKWHRPSDHWFCEKR